MQSNTKLYRLATGLILIFVSLSLKAQYVVDIPLPEEGDYHKADEMRSASPQLKHYILAPLEGFKQRRQVDKTKDQFRVYQFAQNRELNLDLNGMGEWLEAQDGTKLWKFQITSPKALSVSVLLDDFHLEQGDKLWVYSKLSRPHGALTNINNSETGLLQLAPIKGESLCFLYQPANNSKQIPFNIKRLSHGFRALAQGNKLKEIQDENKNIGEPFYDFYYNTIVDLQCSDNVIKHEREDLQARSVVLLILDGDLVATGALINNTLNDGTAYILTASHCVNRIFKYRDDLDKVKQSVQTTVAFFCYQSPIPNSDVRADETKTISGAELIAYNKEADMALIKLTGLPINPKTGKKEIPETYNPYFSGWNISPKPKAPFYNIHHPNGSIKRFNEAIDKSLDITPIYTINNIDFFDKHWSISEWAIGSTAGGSSGSPLFDYSGHIIGALSGGVSYCSSRGSDKFYALCRTWTDPLKEKSLKPFLDPNNSKVESCEGLDPLKDNKLYRLGGLQGRDIPYKAYQGNDERIARVFNIEKAENLNLRGIYLLFKADDKIYKDFPKHKLELYKGKTPTNEPALWSKVIKHPNYNYYDANQKKFAQNPVTFFKTYVEIFIPSQELKLEEGKYTLVLRNLDETKKVTLPILQNKYSKDIGGLSYAYNNGSWTTIPSCFYWLDLLVQTDKPLQMAVEDTQGFATKCYYADDKLVLDLRAISKAISPNEQDIKLKIFNLNGQLCYEQNQISANFHILDLPMQEQGLCYLAVITINGKKEVVKFIK